MARPGTTPRCKRCGEPITFLPMRLKSGLFKFAPHNLDDRTLHFARCKKIQEAREARKTRGPLGGKPQSPQGDPNA